MYAIHPGLRGVGFAGAKGLVAAVFLGTLTFAGALTAFFSSAISRYTCWRFAFRAASSWRSSFRRTLIGVLGVKVVLSGVMMVTGSGAGLLRLPVGRYVRDSAGSSA